MISTILLALASASCELNPDPAAPFAESRVEATGVRVIVELHLRSEADVPWATEHLERFDTLGVPAVVVVPLLDDPPDALLALVDRAAAGPHEVAVQLTSAQVPTDVLDKSGPMRRKLAPYERVAKVRVALAPIQSKSSEAVLGRMGYRTLIDTLASASGAPRMAGHLEGQPRINVVLPPGNYDDACGPSPVASPFSPAAADRVVAAMLRSAAEPTATPVTRVALDASRAAATDAEVFERWLSQVLRASGAQVVTASAARVDALQGFRRTPVGQAPTATRPAPGRLVTVERITEAAAAIRASPTLPRTLPGDLNPTEAFLAMALLLTGAESDASVRLRPLTGPSAAGRPSGATDVDRAALVATLTQLLAVLPPELPISVPVDGKLLSTTELLSVMAAAVLGESPLAPSTLADPDPNARGLGWGASTL